MKNALDVATAVQRVARFYGEAMLESGLTREQISRVHLVVIQKELETILAKKGR